jgi:hypothetical protein
MVVRGRQKKVYAISKAMYPDVSCVLTSLGCCVMIQRAILVRSKIVIKPRGNLQWNEIAAVASSNLILWKACCIIQNSRSHYIKHSHQDY